MWTSLRPVGKRSLCGSQKQQKEASRRAAPSVACPKRVCGRTAPDAPERVYDQRRCTRSEPSDVVLRIARERVPTMGIDLTSYVDAQCSAGRAGAHPAPAERDRWFFLSP